MLYPFKIVYSVGNAWLFMSLGGPLSYYADHLGSVAAMSWAGGTLISGSLARYEPFGNCRTEPATTVNPDISSRGFTGHRTNNTGIDDIQNIGLIYMNARYYLPEIGRFISADSIVPEPGNPQSFNRYAYVRNSPINSTDPTGHLECIDRLCDLVWNEHTDRPLLRGPLPTAIKYIYGEMTRNATSYTAQAILTGNLMADLPLTLNTTRVLGYLGANAIWASQVMDASIKEYAGFLAPYLANWDHKPILLDETNSPVPEIAKRGDSSTIGTEFYRFDIWSNIHYGYVGAASGFSESELINGAGLEQIGSGVVQRGRIPSPSPNAPTLLSSWDGQSDTASIQIGANLWNNYALSVTPADVYLAVIDETRLCSTACLGGR